MTWAKFIQMKVPEGLKEDTKEVWKNNKYECQLRFMDGDIKGWVWISFKHLTKEAIHDWRAMQRIKNELIGPEREGFEIFPAESRLVDTSNQFHIFVLPEGEKLAVGYAGRSIVKGHNDFTPGVGGSKQRGFSKEDEPEDAVSLKEMKKAMVL